MDRQLYENSKKCEEETLTRIHFESRLNLLHNLNMKLESKVLLLSKSNDDLQTKIKKLDATNERLLMENQGFKRSSVGTDKREKELATEAEVANKMKEDMEK